MTNRFFLQLFASFVEAKEKKEKISKILGFFAILGTALYFASCNGNPEEESGAQTENNGGTSGAQTENNGGTDGSDNNKNITFVGSWKSNYHHVLFGAYGHTFFDFNEDGTFSMKTSLEGDENGVTANPEDPIEFIGFYRGNYTYTDTKIICSDVEVSFDETSGYTSSDDIIYVYSDLTATSFSAYWEEAPEVVLNYTRQ